MADRSINEFRIQNPKDWKKLIDQLFPKGIPTRSIWEDHDSIVKVLNHIGSIANVNYLFFPNGGGLDLNGAQSANEEGLIELGFGSVARACKIANLSFESFGDDEDYQWNYFRIETERIESTDTYEMGPTSIMEELTEIYPGQYAPRSAWDNREYRGESLPDTARLVVRILSGSIVIVQKTSFLNMESNFDTGAHNKLSSEELRAEIEEIRGQALGV
jgi:serine/threonine-protein kinase